MQTETPKSIKQQIAEIEADALRIRRSREAMLDELARLDEAEAK